MSRKAKQADLRRRMAEARSKLLQSQNPLQDDIEGSEERVDNSDVATRSRKRPLSPGGGSGGILRKSKYTAIKDSAAKPNSLGALMDGYGDSSSEDDDDDDDDNQNKSRAVVSSAATVKITAPHPSQTTKKEESKHQYKPNDGNKLSKSVSISKPAQAKDEASISDEVWDEFNAILEADEEANVAATNTTTTNDEKLNSTKSIADDKDTIQHDNEKSPASQHDTEVELNDEEEIKKDDLYDNDDMNTMEQTSYEARLARLILLKSKKKKKKQTQEMSDESASANLPSASDFYDPSLAWAEDDEQEDGKVEEQISSEMDRDGEQDGTTSSKHITSASLSSSAASVSMATILRSRRQEARMLASRGEQVAGEGDLSEDMDTSDGKWF